jgi:integrase
MKCDAQKIGKYKYKLIVSMGNDGTGHYPRKTKRVDDIRNKGQLEEAKAKFIYELTNGLIDNRENMLFSELIKDWWQKHTSHLSPRTQEGYESNLRLRILPTFSKLRIGKIKKYHMLDFFDKLQQKNCEFAGRSYNLSAKTIDNHKIVLNSIFSYAVEREYIRESPMKGVKTPSVGKKHVEIYEKTDLAKLFHTLREEPLFWQSLILFAIATSTREGEIAGLDWDSLHLEADSASAKIKQAIIRVKGKGIQLKSTKSGHERSEVLPNFVIPYLKQLSVERKKEQLLCAETWTKEWDGKPCNFVFSPDGGFGKPIRPESIGQWWRRFLKRKGLKHIKFHSLRHTSISLLIDEKVPMKDISERAGHTSGIGITMDLYGHLLIDSDRRAAMALDKAFNEISK